MSLSALALLAAACAPQSAARPTDAPRAQVRFAVQLTRTDKGGDTAPKAQNGLGSASVQVVGAPVMTTLDGGTGSISVSGAGGEISYAISLSPSRETGKNVALLWNLQLSGKGLPGATSVTVNGASRVAVGREEPVVEVTLKDPRTERTSSFGLRITTTITDP